MREMLEHLRKAGVNVKSDRRASSSLPLAGSQYVLTGSLDSLTRGQAEQRLKALGASVGSSVTKKTAGLIAGEDPGSKLDRARALGTPILDEAEFVRLLQGSEATIANPTA
jgi:DNA ligase (NAD+)